MAAQGQSAPWTIKSTSVLAAVLLAGLATSWFWLTYSPGLAASLPLTSKPGANTVFYVIVFVPIAVLGVVLAMLCRAPLLPAGHGVAMWLMIGLLIGGGGLVGAVAMTWLNGGIVEGAAANGLNALLALGLVLILLQASAEEILLRGWLQPVLVRALSPLPGILLASIAFALLHLAIGPIELSSFANIVLAGVLFGVLRHRTGGLVAPVAAHFAWNAVEDLVFGAYPNPGVGPFGALIDVDMIGPVHWGGGETGFNASVGATFVLAALVLAVSSNWPTEFEAPGQ